MWSTMVTLNTMVLVDTKLMVYIMLKSDYMFIKYPDPNMVPTDTMGFRVTTGNHMCLCSHGLSLSDLTVTCSGNSIAKRLKTTAAEAHVVHHGDPEPHGVGGHQVDG